jgi:hypothetical protein
VISAKYIDNRHTDAELMPEKTLSIVSNQRAGSSDECLHREGVLA